MTTISLINSPGSHSDAIAQARCVQYQDRGDYRLVRCAERANYEHGNKLQLPHVPAPELLAHWCSVWEQEFGDSPEVEQRVLEWETATTELPADGELVRIAAQHELTLERTTVFSARELVKPPGRDAIDIRIATGSDWDAVLQLAQSETEVVEVAEFLEWRFSHYRALAEQGFGQWWCAWSGETLGAGAGLFWSDRCGRFQEVVTRAAFRRQGLCAQLCYQVAREFGRVRPDLPLLIAAEHGSTAERIYRRIGFGPLSTLWCLTGPRPARSTTTP